MPTMVISTSVPANGTAFPMANTQWEYMPYPADIEIGFKADATGLLCTVVSGPDLLQEEGPVTFSATANLLPIYPDDFHLEDEVAQHDRLKIQLRNTTGGAIVVRTVIKINPM
jgi:hypothetical protein